jgi:cell division transport system permease protein
MADPVTAPVRQRPFGARLMAMFGRQPLVSPDPVTDRALTAVVAVLTFLAALTVGAAEFATTTALRWQVMMSSEVTVQLKPQGSRPMEADIVKVSDVLRGTNGIVSVKVLSREDSARLLEPWLGSGPALDNLPLPRLISVGIDTAHPPDLAALSRAISELAPGVSLDDHRTWTKQLDRLSSLFLIAATGALGLVVLATALSIVFATRGTMAGNREIIEVLHFIGADDRYIARQFQRHFIFLGAKGGGLGGGLAILVIVAVRTLFGWSLIANPGSLADAAFPGWPSLVAIAAVILLVAVIAGAASRITVFRTIGRLN